MNSDVPMHGLLSRLARIIMSILIVFVLYLWEESAGPCQKSLIDVQKSFERVSDTTESRKTRRCGKSSSSSSHHLRRFARAEPPDPVSVVFRFGTAALVADRRCCGVVTSEILLRRGTRGGWRWWRFSSGGGRTL